MHPRALFSQAWSHIWLLPRVNKINLKILLRMATQQEIILHLQQEIFFFM